MPHRINLNGVTPWNGDGSSSPCPRCHEPYTPPPEHPNWRKHPKCYRADLDAADHDTYERGREQGHLEGYAEARAEMEAERVQLGGYFTKADLEEAREDGSRKARFAALDDAMHRLEDLLREAERALVPDDQPF